jgi:Ca2+-binding EF-hand superfamily protein
MNNKENPLASLSPDEYLEKTGVSTVLKDIVTSLIENRPLNPVQFISEYLKTTSAACTGVLKSYKLIKLCKSAQKSFMDNLVSAFMNLDAKKGGNNQGITGTDYMKIIKMICLDFPFEVVDEVLSLLGKRDTDLVLFEEFVAGVNAVLLYEDFFAEVEDLFLYLDPDRSGRVPVAKLFMSMDKLNGTNLTLPRKEELQSSLERLNLDEREFITFGEFCLSLFKILT